MYMALVADIVHPPLHYLVLHFWMNLFGVGVVQARMVSVIFGALSIGGLYLLANYLFDRRTAAIAALLLAVSEIGIRYSQDARPYAQVLFLVVCSSYLFLRSLRSRRASDWWFFIVSAIPLIYTHYYGAFALAAFTVFAILFRKKYPIPMLRWIGGIALLGVAYAPWVFGGVLQQALSGSKIRAVASAREHWYTIFTVVNEFNNGRVNGFSESAPIWTFLLGGALFTLPALLGLRRVMSPPLDEQRDIQRENGIFLAVLFGVPIILAFSAGATMGFYYDRYVAFCALPYYLLAARGIQSLDSLMLRRAFIGLGIAYSVYALRANYSLPSKENYRDSLAYVAQFSKAGDCYVVGTPWLEQQVQRAWSIYQPTRPELSLTELDSLSPAGGACGRVWLITIAAQDRGDAIRLRHEAQNQLAAHYSATNKQEFFWSEVDLYQRNSPPSADARRAAER
jgi:4-amino-4-deoxy-L-arabinose transferase-like glycosyltransferase